MEDHTVYKELSPDMKRDRKGEELLYKIIRLSNVEVSLGTVSAGTDCDSFEKEEDKYKELEKGMTCKDIQNLEELYAIANDQDFEQQITIVIQIYQNHGGDAQTLAQNFRRKVKNNPTYKMNDMRRSKI
ncbi:hypothetical protein KY284_010235 [Solanum tuberosum]|nr:hypothetical protein KY284_010235 [Solanum tuberosum]